MQEYVEERTVAISVKAGKLSGRALAAACKKVLAEMKKHHEAAKRPHGRQSVKKLMAHGENVNSIEVEAPKLFDRMARRFNVDYAFYKTGPDKYLLFFKAGQADAITACFERYSRRLLEQSKSSRIPIREQLKKAAEQLVKEPPKTQERTKEVVREER